MILDKRFSDEIVYLASLGLFNMKLFIINFDFLDFNKIKIKKGNETIFFSLWNFLLSNISDKGNDCLFDNYLISSKKRS